MTMTKVPSSEILHRQTVITNGVQKALQQGCATVLYGVCYIKVHRLLEL